MSANPLAPEWLHHPADANALASNVWSTNSSRSNGELTVAGVSASDLAEQFGTPLYVAGKQDARRRVR